MQTNEFKDYIFLSFLFRVCLIFNGVSFFFACLTITHLLSLGTEIDVGERQRLLEPWYLYHMVTQNMLRTNERKKFFRR